MRIILVSFGVIVKLLDAIRTKKQDISEKHPDFFEKKAIVEKETRSE